MAQSLSMKKLWPLWVSVGFPLLLIVFNATPVGLSFVFMLTGLPALFALWCILGGCAFVLAVRKARRREWSAVALCSVLPLVVFVSALWRWPLLHFCNDAGDIAYFIAARSSYVNEISKAPLDGASRLMVFDRGGMSWASRGYVYDESDEITRDASHQSHSWKARADGTELSCGYYAQAFPGHLPFTQHWYLASFSC